MAGEDWELDVAALMRHQKPMTYQRVLELDDELAEETDLEERGEQIYPPPPPLRRIQQIDIVIVTGGKSLKVETVGQIKYIAHESWFERGYQLYNSSWQQPNPLIQTVKFLHQAAIARAYPVTTGAHYIPIINSEPPEKPKSGLGDELGPSITSEEILGILATTSPIAQLARAAIGIERLARDDAAWRQLPEHLSQASRWIAEKRPKGYEDVLASLLRSYTRSVNSRQADSLLPFLEARMPAPVKLPALAATLVLFSHGPAPDEAKKLIERLSVLQRSFEDPELFCVQVNVVLFVAVCSALTACGAPAGLERLQSMPMHVKRLAAARLRPLRDTWLRNEVTGPIPSEVERFLNNL